MEFVRLTPEHEIKPFDCGTVDLNEFLLNDAKNNLSQLLAVTYLIENDERTIAYFSLLNDKIQLDEDEKKAWYKLISADLPHAKKRRSYPAMKIGRLAVDKCEAKRGLGTAILDMLKQMFVTNNRTGCKFIIVDAKDQSLGFYEKNGFKYLTEKDKGKQARIMYYNLRQMVG